MAIAINPDVRELDFSDNVKVSKFMQDFSDFRMKKWITYRPVNAPSESAPFHGGTRQFIINMGTGHILDTTYSGLWYTIKFANGSAEPNWPISTTMPRTSSAWIESVTFQHSNVAAHIDERLCDYDAVSSIFTPAKDIKSMDQTFFHFDYSKCADNNPFNNFSADDPIAKALGCGIGGTQRCSYAIGTFFIPLCRLSTIFNSGKYFFPSLLRGNGEMTLSIRSVANSLSEIFGGHNCSFSSFASSDPNDRIYRSLDGYGLNWVAVMDDMKLITLNLDNAFLTKEYNAFIASGRKFIRSFKGYNYQYYQVRRGYNRIEIANTHQSISHIILAFQTAYSVRLNGSPCSACDDMYLGNQRTVAVPPGLVSSVRALNNSTPIREEDLVKFTIPTLANKVKAGDTSVHTPEATNHYIGPVDNDPTDISSYSDIEIKADNRSLMQKATDFTKSTFKSAVNLAADSYKVMAENMKEGEGFTKSANKAIGTALDKVVEGAKATLAPPKQGSAGGVRSQSVSKRNTRSKVTINDLEKENKRLAEALERTRQHQAMLQNMTGTTNASKAPLVSDDELKQWEELIAKFFPDFEWKTLDNKKINDRASYIAYLKDTVTGSHKNYRKVQNNMKESFTALNYIQSLNQYERSLFAALFGNKASKMYKLAGEFIEKKAKDLKDADLKLLRYMYANNIQLPSTQDDFKALCEKAIASPESATICTQMILDNIQGLVTVGTNGENADETDLGTEDLGVGANLLGLARTVDGAKIIATIINNNMPTAWLDEKTKQPIFTDDQRQYMMIVLNEIMSEIYDSPRITWHSYSSLMLPCEAKQIYDMGLNVLEKLQVYRGTGNGETVFSEPINENMFYHVSREAMGDGAEDHPFFSRKGFDKDCAYIVISLNTFMRDAHHEYWDGFSTNRVADRLYVEFENIYLFPGNLTAIPPWYYDMGYIDNTRELICKVFTVYDNIYYIDRNNNLNVSDTLLPLQEGRGPASE